MSTENNTENKVTAFTRFERCSRLYDAIWDAIANHRAIEEERGQQISVTEVVGTLECVKLGIMDTITQDDG